MPQDSWLDEHGDYLFAFALRRVRDAQMAEDLVQDTLLAALERKQMFEGRSSVRTWLVAILRHKLADHCRRRARSGQSPRPFSANEEPLGPWVDQQFTKGGKWVQAPGRWRDSDHLTAPELEELRTALADCLQRLPPIACEALLLAEQSDIPARQIRNVLKVSTTNIGVMLFRARTALRKCLEDRWFGRKSGREDT